MKYAIAFAGVAALLVMMSWRIWTSFDTAWGLWFLYPAVAFALISSTYARNDPGCFGKRGDGGRSVSRTLLLAPYLLLVAAVWHGLRLMSREPPYSRLGGGLILGRRLLSTEIPPDAASVVDLTCEFVERPGVRLLGTYRCMPLLDAAAPTADALDSIAVEISQMPGPVLIHCAQGHGRTGMVAAAVLIIAGEAKTAEQAISMVRAIRPGVSLNRQQRAALIGVANRRGIAT